MVNLLLMRHGIAEEPAPGVPDARRCLTDIGRRRTTRAVRGLARLELVPALVVSSPLVRAAQTATIVRRVLGVRQEVRVEPALSPGTSPQAAAEALARHAHAGVCLMAVGHQPLLGAIAGLLCFGDALAGLPLRKAGVAQLALTAPITPGRCATLTALLTPGQLRRAAG